MQQQLQGTLGSSFDAALSKAFSYDADLGDALEQLESLETSGQVSGAQAAALRSELATQSSLTGFMKKSLWAIRELLDKAAKR